MVNNKRFKAERTASGKTQGEVAKALGITLNSYHNKESGRTKFTVDEFEAFVDFLNIGKENMHIFFN